MDIIKKVMKSPDNLKIISRPELGQHAWDGLVESSDEAWLWHRYDLQDAASTWSGKTDFSFAIIDENLGGTVVAIIPLHGVSRRVSFWSWKTLDSTGGLACANRLSTREKRQVRTLACNYVRTLASREGASMVNFSLSPLAPAFRGDECPRVNPLLDLGCTNTLGQTWLIDLRQGIEKVWSEMETRARTAVRKAEKQGVAVRLAKGIEDLGTYYELHSETYQRSNFRPHPKVYFEAIWNNFVEKGLAHILFAVWQGQVVAAENFGFYKNAAIYWTGAASQVGLSLAANSLLQWKAMQWMVENNFGWYETGEAYPNLLEGKLKGLSNFKKSFGGKLYPYYKGRMVFRKKLYALYQFYKALRET
jgi:hypothetical protein